MEARTINSLPTTQRVGSSSAGPTPPPRPAANDRVTCHQKLQKYTWIWNNRPKDNNINFWRRFVLEFFTFDSTKKLCLMAYKDNSATMMKINRFLKEESPCCHCKRKSEYGYGISFEEMPLYFHNKFSSLDNETLHLGMPTEYKLKNGATLLYFPEVVEEASRKYARTIRRGPLAVAFSPHKKIISWQFCMHHSIQLVSYSSLLPQFRGSLQIASESRSGQACSQEMQENRKTIIKNMCEIANNLNMNQFDELGLSVKDLRTFMKSNPLNDMKDKMHSGVQGNLVPRDRLHNYKGPEATDPRVQHNNPTSVKNFLINQNKLVSENLTPANKNPNNHTAGNNLLINQNKLVSENLMPANKNPCTSMTLPDLGDRNITQQLNMQHPPLLNPTNLQGTSSTNSWPITESTLSAVKNGAPGCMTDHVAQEATRREPSIPIPNPLKRPFPENNSSMNPQQGRMTRQKQGEATSNGRLGYENNKVVVSDLIKLRPSQPMTGPSPSIERGKDDCNDKGKGIMQEAENRNILVERDTRPDLTIKMPSNGACGTESDSSSVGVNMAAVDGNQLTEGLIGSDIDIDSLLHDISMCGDINVDNFLIDDMSIYGDLQDL